jgi:tripartite-type tricarboxylate transporter receptor subunit TctC
MKIRLPDLALKGAAAAAVLAMALPSGTALAQAAAKFPTKPITLIIPYTPGSTNDIEARIYQESLQEQFKSSVLLDYKPGASGIIANGYVAKAAPDGHTLAWTSATTTILPALRTDLPYDFLKDLAPVGQTTKRIFLLTSSPDLPVKDFKELVTYAKANPGKLAYSTVGQGGAIHLSGVWMASASGMDLNFVHYKGAAASDIDLMSGRIQLSAKGLVGAVPLIKSGKIKLLAIYTGERTQLLPGTPTVAESGIPGFDYPSWVGILAPGATPKPIVDRLSAEFKTAVHSPKAQKSWDSSGTIAIGSTPEQFRKMLVAEAARWKKLVADNGIKAELND